MKTDIDVLMNFFVSNDIECINLIFDMGGDNGSFNEFETNNNMEVPSDIVDIIESILLSNFDFQWNSDGIYNGQSGSICLYRSENNIKVEIHGTDYYNNTCSIDLTNIVDKAFLNKHDIQEINFGHDIDSQIIKVDPNFIEDSQIFYKKNKILTIDDKEEIKDILTNIKNIIESTDVSKFPVVESYSDWSIRFFNVVIVSDPYNAEVLFSLECDSNFTNEFELSK